MGIGETKQLKAVYLLTQKFGVHKMGYTLVKKILELREKRAKAWEAAKAFLDSKLC